LPKQHRGSATEGDPVGLFVVGEVVGDAVVDKVVGE
jgi:hypothetical protein